MGKLKGYRTYILGATAVIGGAAGYLVGDMSAMEAIQTTWAGLLAITMRDAIKDPTRIF